MPPLRAPPGPSRSSRDPALPLAAVDGRDGGPPGDALDAGGIPPPSGGIPPGDPSPAGVVAPDALTAPTGGVEASGGVMILAGVPLALRGGGIDAPLAEREGGPLGGGGAAADAATTGPGASAPAFLLTHFFVSVS